MFRRNRLSCFCIGYRLLYGIHLYFIGAYAARIYVILQQYLSFFTDLHGIRIGIGYDSLAHGRLHGVHGDGGGIGVPV